MNEDNAYIILEEAIENKNNDTIFDLNSIKIQKIKRKIFQKLNFKINEIEIYENKLKEYIYIDDIHKFTIGSYYRWFTSPNNILNKGGILMDIKIYDDGIYLLMKNMIRKFFTIKYDNIILFKKCSIQEQILLLAIDNIL